LITRYSAVDLLQPLCRGAAAREARRCACTTPPIVQEPGAAERYAPVVASPVLIEFPADDADRARRFWAGVLGASLEERAAAEGAGWQTRAEGVAVGVHARGPGPGDRVSLAYFAVADLPAALQRIVSLGGEIIHPGERWAICRDSEGSPFGLAATEPG